MNYLPRQQFGFVKASIKNSKIVVPKDFNEIIFDEANQNGRAYKKPGDPKKPVKLKILKRSNNLAKDQTELKKLYDVQSYNHMRLPYRLVLADLNIADEEVGMLIGASLQRMVDFASSEVQKPEEEIQSQLQTFKLEAGEDEPKNWILKMRSEMNRKMDNYELLRVEKIKQRGLDLKEYIKEGGKSGGDKLFRDDYYLRHELKHEPKYQRRSKFIQFNLKNIVVKDYKAQGTLLTKEYREDLKARLKKLREDAANRTDKSTSLPQTPRKRFKLKEPFEDFNKSQVSKYQKSFELIKESRLKNSQKLQKMREQDFLKKGFGNFNNLR